MAPVKFDRCRLMVAGAMVDEAPWGGGRPRGGCGGGKAAPDAVGGSGSGSDFSAYIPAPYSCMKSYMIWLVDRLIH